MPRRRGAVALCGLSICLFSASCGSQTPAGGGIQVKGPVPTKAGLSLPPEGKLFGFNDQTFAFTGGPQPQLDQGVTAQRQALDALAGGANSARVTVAWYGVEPQRGRYDRSYVDLLKAYTSRIEQSGGRVLLTLGVPPAWARAAPGQATSAIKDRPDLVAAFGRFARFVAAEWPDAAAIEVWNEPNTTYFWRPGRPDPSLYARMHKAAARGIRAAGTGVPILLAGLLGVERGNENVMRPVEFIRAAFNAGLTASDYDAAAYHAYPVPSGRRLPNFRTGPFARALKEFSDAVALVEGGRMPPLWITETGLTTTGTWAVSPRDQARGVLNLLALFASRPEVAAVYLHTLYVPSNQPESSIERGFGLLRARGAMQGAPTLAFCSLRAVARDPGSFAGCPSA